MAEHNDDAFSDDGLHFDDAQLEAALSDFEKEFQEQETSQDHGSDEAGVADSGSDDSDMVHAAEDALRFDEDLEGLLGNRAKVAMLITRITAAELLAAFCQISDISATCVESHQGAVALLHNLDGDGPEAAARDLTQVVSGLGVILAVNRADKLETTVYLDGNAGQTMAPPIVFTTTEPFVEDLMLGIDTPQGVIDSGRPVYESGDLTTEQAYDVLAKYLHTKWH